MYLRVPSNFEQMASKHETNYYEVCIQLKSTLRTVQEHLDIYGTQEACGSHSS